MSVEICEIPALERSRVDANSRIISIVDGVLEGETWTPRRDTGDTFWEPPATRREF